MTKPQDVLAEDAMTPQQVAEYAVWYARKVKGPAAKVAAALLEEFPWLREPLEAAALVRTPEPLDGARLRREIEALPDGRTLVDLRREHEWARQRHAAGGYPSHEYCEACFLLAIVDRLAALVRTPETLDAGHRTREPHDCFLMNCRDLGDEVEELRVRLAASPSPTPPEGLRWHHSPDAPPEHFCEDCDRAVRLLGLAEIRARNAEAALAASPAPDPGAGLREREAAGRLLGVAATVVRIRQEGSAANLVEHPYIWHDLDDAVRVYQAALSARPAATEPADGLRDGPWAQLSEAATPGPWHVEEMRGKRDGYIRAGGRTVGDLRYRNGEADAAFIVAAVNYVRSCLRSEPVGPAPGEDA